MRTFRFPLFFLLLAVAVSVFAAEPTLPEGKNLQFGGAFSGTEDSFTFGIIADRFGANPVVGWPYFEQAVRDLNCLHPDFVIMPGDLIDGYISKDDPQQARQDFNIQFDEFAQFANKLEMPLYFAAGNHDLSRESMKAPFVERFGRLWYSFDYRGVHFMGLNTEAQPHGENQDHHFTDEQVEWALADIAASADARHTVVAMHYPAWRTRNEDTTMYKQWLRIEDALKGRKYTVFAAHTHGLASDVRNGAHYYTMGTTGGGQAKPHSFYRGRMHHIGLAKIEGDALYLSIIDLGAVHDIDDVAKDNASPLCIETLRPLARVGEGFMAEFSATVTNPLDRDLRVTFSLAGLAPKGWASSAGAFSSAVVAPGDSAAFRTVLSVADLNVSCPPNFAIHAAGEGLEVVDHNAAAPLFAPNDYRVIPTWLAAAPFDGEPLAYEQPPFDPRKVLPAMFEDHGPEGAPWDRGMVFEGGVQWREIGSDERGRVDFGKQYGYLTRSVGYATVFVTSPDDRLTYLQLAANDYGRFFVNGQVVGKEVYFAEDGTVTVPIWLKKGKNRILAKNANWSNNWYFVLTIADPDHTLTFE